MFRRILLAAFLLMLALPASAKEARIYVFGNSLINHLDGGDETAVPYWLARMAKAAGHEFAADGQWGFLRDFTRPEEPTSNWSFSGVTSAWNRDRMRFKDADLTAVMVNPANFIQYNQPDAPYDGDNPDQISPLEAMDALIDLHVGDRPLLIYEGWAEMAGVTRQFPPRKSGLSKYHLYNMGDYHDWYVTLSEQLTEARPGADIRLIPVARMLSQLLTEAPLDAIGAEDLYTDNAPHGTSTLYYLAAMTVFPAIYGEAAPRLEGLEGAVHPLVIEHQSSIADRVMELQDNDVQARVDPLQEGKAASSQVAAEAERTPSSQQSTQITNPSLALGLDGISDWSTQHPFLNIMKTARPWVGHVGDEWGAITMDDLARRGLLDGHGYPRRIPAEASKLEAFVLTDQPEAATDMASRYRIRWKGTGELSVTGRGQTARMNQGENETWLDYTPGDGLVSISITSTDPEGTGDHIRDIEIVREDHIPFHDAGATFNPAWIDRIADMRSLRFMDWMLTNGSPVKSWEGRPLPEHFSYAWRGVPAEVMIKLANKVGADPWFCMPHAADDDYMISFAELTRERLDPRLKAHVEFSNELWNQIFPQAKWAEEQARKRWGEQVEGDAWMQYAGIRSAEVMDIWAEVYGRQAKSRLVRIMGVHTGWMGLEEPFMQAPRAVSQGLAPPVESFDAYAVSGYFGFDLGLEDEGLPKVRQIVERSRGKAEQAARKKGLERKALEAEIEPIKFDEAYPEVSELLWEGSFKELTEVLWPYHAQVAEAHDLQLVMYEGGTHVTPHGEALNDEELVDFFTSFNYDSEIGKLYEELLHRWRGVGGTLFNAFVDVAKPTKYGSWGALRHLQDENPRWDALVAANEINTEILPERPAGTFLHGVTITGGQGPDRMIGTLEEDVLVGGPGDDYIKSLGGNDIINGGPGEDIVELPGQAADYRLYRDGDVVIARREGGGLGTYEVKMLDVEKLYFSSEPARKYVLDLN
ncbi:MAG: calcium-binding protein [Spiribacter salinus]|uniref:Calcium-binding protein n=1 Tax=Spiribacter salinus TaxID=1335746 RepID=A0A540VVU8_9GAMM|nr:MAG: calcium-binding protein [Spiribacter salinus]